MLLQMALEEGRIVGGEVLGRNGVKLFSCCTIPKAWHAPWFWCAFSCCTLPSILYA